MADQSRPPATFKKPENDDGSISLFDLRTEIKAELENTPGMSQAKASTQIGFSPAILSTWLRGEYKGDNTKVEKQLRAWLDGRRRKVAAARKVPAGIAWFEGPTAASVYQALDFAQTMADLVVICGGAGLGKTTTAEHYQGANSAVWYARMSPSSSTSSSCLTEVAEALGIRPRRGEGARQILKSIIRKVRETDGLIIIDEAQELEKPALEELRAIHDEAKIGLALIGNESVYMQLTGGTRAAHYAQLFSRIGMRVRLDKPKKSDVSALAKSWGIEDPEAVELLEKIAQQAGALRMVTKTIKLAFMDEDAPTPPDQPALMRAWQYVGAER